MSEHARPGCVWTQAAFAMVFTGTLAHWSSTFEIDISFEHARRLVCLGFVIGAIIVLSSGLTIAFITVSVAITDAMQETVDVVMEKNGFVSKGSAYKGTTEGIGFRSRRDHRPAMDEIGFSLGLATTGIVLSLFIARVFSSRLRPWSNKQEPIAYGEYVLEGVSKAPAVKLTEFEPMGAHDSPPAPPSALALDASPFTFSLILKK